MNKRLDILNGILDLMQQSTPSTPPASNRNQLYFKSDGLLYQLDHSGTESLVGSGGGGGQVFPPSNDLDMGGYGFTDISGLSGRTGQDLFLQPGTGRNVYIGSDKVTVGSSSSGNALAIFDNATPNKLIASGVLGTGNNLSRVAQIDSPSATNLNIASNGTQITFSTDGLSNTRMKVFKGTNANDADLNISVMGSGLSTGTIRLGSSYTNAGSKIYGGAQLGLFLEGDGSSGNWVKISGGSFFGFTGSNQDIGPYSTRPRNTYMKTGLYLGADPWQSAAEVGTFYIGSNTTNNYNQIIGDSTTGLSLIPMINKNIMLYGDPTGAVIATMLTNRLLVSKGTSDYDAGNQWVGYQASNTNVGASAYAGFRAFTQVGTAQYSNIYMGIGGKGYTGTGVWKKNVAHVIGSASDGSAVPVLIGTDVASAPIEFWTNNTQRASITDAGLVLGSGANTVSFAFSGPDFYVTNNSSGGGMSFTTGGTYALNMAITYLGTYRDFLMFNDGTKDIGYWNATPNYYRPRDIYASRAVHIGDKTGTTEQGKLYMGNGANPTVAMQLYFKADKLLYKNDGSTETLVGDGGILGPVSSTDNAIAVWDGLNGDALKDSSVTVASDGLGLPYHNLTSTYSSADRFSMRGKTAGSGASFNFDSKDAAAADLVYLRVGGLDIGKRWVNSQFWLDGNNLPIVIAAQQGTAGTTWTSGSITNYRTVYMSGTSGLIWSTDGGADIGAATGNRPNHIYAKTSVNIGTKAGETGNLYLGPNGLKLSNAQPALDDSFVKITAGGYDMFLGILGGSILGMWGNGWLEIGASAAHRGLQFDSSVLFAKFFPSEGTANSLIVGTDNIHDFGYKSGYSTEYFRFQNAYFGTGGVHVGTKAGETGVLYIGSSGALLSGNSSDGIIFKTSSAKSSWTIAEPESKFLYLTEASNSANGIVMDSRALGLTSATGFYIFQPTSVNAWDNYLGLEWNGTRWTLNAGSEMALFTADGDLVLGAGYTIQHNQSVSYKRTGVTNHTVDYNDSIVGVTDTSVARTITLPAASTVNSGFVVIVKDESGAANATNSITIAPDGTDTIDGAASVAITSAYGVIRLYCDGSSKWFSM